MSQCAMLSTRFKKITAVLDFYKKETDLSQFAAQQNQTALFLQNILKDLLAVYTVKWIKMLDHLRKLVIWLLETGQLSHQLELIL